VISLWKIREQFSLEHFFRVLNVKQYVARYAMTALAVVVLVGAVLGIKAFQLNARAKAVEESITAIQNEITGLKASTVDLYRERDDYLKVRAGLLKQASFVKMLNRVSWSQVLSVVAKEMPKRLRLTSFKFNEAGQVSFL